MPSRPKQATARAQSVDEASFERLWQSAPDAMVGVDSTGVIRFANRHAEVLFGYGRDEVVGQPIEILVPRASQQAHPALRSGYVAHPEDRPMRSVLGLAGRRRDGTEFPADISLSSTQTSDGLLVTAAVHDITARTEPDQDLRRIGSIIEYSGDAIVSVSLDDIITSWNPAAGRLYGYTAAEAQGEPASMLVPPGHDDDVAEILARVTREERVEHYETYRITKDSRVIDVSVSASPIRDPHGGLIGVSTIARDITDRKRADRDLQRMASIIECSDDAVVSKSLDGVITSWNPAAEQLYGYTATQARGRSAVMLIPPGRDDDIAEILGRVTRGERVEHYETSQISKDARVIDVSVSASPLRDPHGNLIGASTIARDITDRKKAEATIRALNADLENRVVARTAELAEAVEELGAFSHSVSHDLRAPLRAIDGFSRIVLEEYGHLLDAEGQRLLNVIRGATIDMTALIDDLLAFSRIGRQPIRMAEIDMHDLTAAVVRDLAPTYQGRDVRIAVGALPPAFGDRALIRQVLVNLLSNAVKFTTSRQHAQIDITGAVEGDQSVFSVEDNGFGFGFGFGFGMACHEKLFQVFQRLHPTEFEGTGVGLAIVQRIVRRHGGRIWADGRVDDGATFSFALPTGAKEAP